MSRDPSLKPAIAEILGSGQDLGDTAEAQLSAISRQLRASPQRATRDAQEMLREGLIDLDPSGRLVGRS